VERGLPSEEFSVFEDFKSQAKVVLVLLVDCNLENGSSGIFPLRFLDTFFL
jgi:hypothetical protein